MIYCGPIHLFIIYMILQLPVTNMTTLKAPPYTSQFSYTPEHHPSLNPSCPTPESRRIRKSNSDKFFITGSHKNNAEDVRSNTESSVEMMATLLPCTHAHNRPINHSNANFSKSQWRRYSKVKKCHRKLVIDIKLTNVGKIATGDQFIVIDHVTDAITMQKSWLIDPYVIKLRQEQVLQLYGLKFESVVNAEATEEVINNKNEHFSGCDDYSQQPTCGQMYYKGMKIPYSQGFCCSCEEETDSTSPAHENETVSDVRPQFHRKRFTDGTKSIEKLLEDLQSHRRYSTISPRHFEAKKYLEKIPTQRSNNSKADLVEKNNRTIEILPSYVSTNNLVKNNERKVLKKKVEYSTLPRQKRRHINRRKWSKNYLNRLRKMLMKNHFAGGKNNEKDVGDNEYSPATLHVPSSTYISPVMRNFLHKNVSSTEPWLKYQPHGQSREMKLYDVDVEKTTGVQTLNWKIPIERGHSFISRNEDLRDLEMQLQSLGSITKKVETTISPISAKPRIIIDRFKITEGNKRAQMGEKFSHRKLLNDISKRRHEETSKNLFTNVNVNKKQENDENLPPQDFAISLTGKIHIDGGANGSPVSITFDTSPGSSNSSDLLQQSSGPLKVNRRSVRNMGIPYEIIPRRVHHKGQMPNKITRSDYSKTLQILSQKNLISNELPQPQMDVNDLETATTTNPGRIKPYSLDKDEEEGENSSLFLPITTKSPENFLQLSEPAANPVNLKIIGLISMSNPGENKIEENSEKKKMDKGWLGDLEIVPLIHVKVEKQSSVGQSPETNEKTTVKPSSCYTSVGQTTTVHSIPVSFTSNVNTKSSDGIPETVTFYVDSDDEEAPSQSSDDKSTMKIMTMRNETNFEKNEFLLTNNGNNNVNNNNNNNNNGIITEKTTTIAEPSPRDDYPTNEPDTRLNNMLAIMEFINKLKSILTGDESCSNEAQPGTVIRLQKFVITPENGTSLVEKLLNEPNNERYVNTHGNSLGEIPRQHLSTNLNGPNESEVDPKQTYITRIIKRRKNVDGEALKGKLIDQYNERDKESGEQANDALEISRELASLNSKDAFENNREVRSRKIVNSGARLERKEVAKKEKRHHKKTGRKKKKRRRKKKRRKKPKKEKMLENRQEAKATNEKTWWPFKRQLMSLTVESVPGEEIYDDEIEEKYREIEAARQRRGSENDKNKKLLSTKNKMKIHEHMNTNSGIHIRGGQNCMDRRHPPNIQPAKYLESAHCLRFSDLWYSVYKLEKPVVEHTVYVQLFKRERVEKENKSRWRDLTRGEMIRLGTFTRHQRDRVPTIVFTYTAEKPREKTFSLDPTSQRLLIPLIEENKKYAEGMREYLIIPSNEITREGRECDKAGVGFSAFVMQKDRCTRKRGSCLRNQPLSYWRHDMHARESGQPGCYFLSNFATVPVNPIKYNVTDVLEKQEYLGLVQNTHHVATLEIEVMADDNNVIAVGPPGRITEVHIDATSGERTKLSIRLTNTGLVSSAYQARIVGCPSGLPSSWASAITPRQSVAPQHDSLLTLNLAGQVTIDRFNCTAEVINYRGELVAARRIIVHKMNRCFCLWHCVCTCYQSPPGFSCSPMTPEYYHRAGFRGPVPTINTRHSEFYQITIDLFLIVLLLISLLLILGILKWLLGIIFPQTGRWGLDSLLSATRFKIDEYLEPDLKCRCVVTDDEGIPIHPDTARRTVRICSRAQEFFINSLFFFLYPSCVLCDCIRRICKCREEKCHCDDDSKDSLIDKECHRVISVRSYGDARDSKLERDDTEYVITQLKKSQVSLGH